jgi:hypothetical protein
MSKRAADHDKYLGIMKSIAQAEEMQNIDKAKAEGKTAKEVVKTCQNCDLKKSCRKFSGRLSTNGTYSIGGDSTVSTCDKWRQRKEIANDPKKIKSLLKQFKRMAR